MSWISIFLIICAIIGVIVGLIFFFEWLKNQAPNWVRFLVVSIVFVGILTTVYWVIINYGTI